MNLRDPAWDLWADSRIAFEAKGFCICWEECKLISTQVFSPSFFTFCVVAGQAVPPGHPGSGTNVSTGGPAWDMEEPAAVGLGGPAAGLPPSSPTASSKWM